MDSEAQRVVIVGGGLAGLAAAAALGERGVPATLLESRPRLGGRASSFQDAATGQWIDNCQHVSMGCCTNFRNFCERTGLREFFRAEPVLHFIAPDGRVNRFAAGPWPAPLHLAGAFARLSYLSWSDKWRLSQGLKRLARTTGPDTGQTFADWLQQAGQSPTAIERFWTVVLVSALSESLDRISVPHARKVFVDAFLANREGWQVEIPTVPLEELYGGRLTNWLTDRGVDIRLLAGAESLDVDGDRVTGVRLKNGDVVTGSDYIVAVPYHRVLPLLPESLREHPSLSGLSRLESAPISSVHLWFDRPVLPLPHAVFVRGLVQWVFNRTLLAGTTPPPGEPWYVQVVISASREVTERDSDAVREQVLTELASVWPAVRSARLLSSRLVTEHKAVFSVTPGVESLRPPQQAPLANLQLAGDYTQTGWPGTMEGAVRSGYRAAENVLKRRGQTSRVLQPDLPVARLSRWVFGL
jgi:squalene-associated FAD-dependent desaturase